ncbi:Rsp5p-dependent ubiquitination, sorting of cargo proteins at the multivesicular body [Nowakowskiella sp. JEL0078]|nr:Rsp5p-dependent ubiquitination, sorting of cargo proteins at the multivesicular body [Nowakowskiella sp. JEL0078]
MAEEHHHTHAHPDLHLNTHILDTTPIAGFGFEAWGASSVSSSFPLEWDTTFIDEEDIDQFLTRYPPPTDAFPPADDIAAIQSLGFDAYRFTPPTSITSPFAQESPRQNSDDKLSVFDRVEVRADGFSVEFKDMHAFASVLGALPLVFMNDAEKERNFFYFEVLVKDKHSHTAISVGLATKPYPPFRLVGWSKYSVGYHSDDGRSFICNDNGVFGFIYATAGSEGGSKGKKYDVDDVVGVGYFPERGSVFFTLNGQYLGEASGGDLTKGESQHPYHAAIGANGAASLLVNFGQNGPFKYEPANVGQDK